MKNSLLTLLILLLSNICGKAQIDVVNATSCGAYVIISAHDAVYSTACSLRSNSIAVPANGSVSFTDIDDVTTTGPAWVQGSVMQTAPWDWDAITISFFATGTPSVSVGTGCVGITTTGTGSPCGPVTITWTYNGTGDVDVLIQ